MVSLHSKRKLTKIYTYIHIKTSKYLKLNYFKQCMKTKMYIFLGITQYFDTCKSCGMPKLIKYIYLIKN